MRDGLLITQGQFDIQMQRIYQTFGEKNYSSQRMALIWQVASRTSYDNFEKICNHLLASFRNAPLPKDFSDAITAEARGKSFFEHQETITIWKPDCAACHDVGIVNCEYRDGGGSALMRCLCAQGDLHDEQIVRWDRSLGQVFNASPCPPGWFKPNFDRVGSDKKIYGAIEQAVLVWKAKLQFAKDFWNFEKKKALENS